MKKSLIIAAVICLSAATACVNKDYDLDNLDQEITVIPGLKLPVNKALETVEVNAMITMPDGGKLSSDQSGDFSSADMESEKKIEVNVGESQIFSETGVSIPGEMHITFDKVPVFLKNAGAGARLSNPAVVLGVESTLAKKSKMSCKLKAGDKTVQIDGIDVPAEACFLRISSDRIKDLFNPMPEEITVSDIVLKATAEKQDIIIESERNVQIALTPGYDIPLTFDSKSTIPLSYTFDLEEDDVDFDSEEFKSIDLSSLELDGVCDNSIPLVLDAVAKAYDADGNEFALVTIDRTALAGTFEAVGEKTTYKNTRTTFKLNLKSDKSLKNMKTVKIFIDATNNYDTPVTLNREQGLSVKLDNIKFDEGITLTF